MSINVFGLSFYLYGLMVGLAIAVGYLLSNWRAKQVGILQSGWDRYILFAFILGLVGARLYHGLTDWQLYENQPWQLLFFWQGGLSVVGAISGGVVGLWLAHRLMKSQHSLAMILDTAAYGLPVAQAIGRIGNFFNQELYGAPTDLPWGIYIDPNHRLTGYETYSRFQPLFAYEAIALILLGGRLWFLSGRQKVAGELFFQYIIYYSIIRFLLEFIRIDKTQLFETNFSFNQLVMMAIGLVALVIWQAKIRQT